MKIMKLSDFVEINPSVKLTNGKEYLCVMMDEITPGRRYVFGENKKAYKGGSRFEKGDVLFARITPCLENGKIAQFMGDGVGFGSTEYFIFRKRDGVSDQGYIFYLACSDIVRKPAEKSMFGASGRQRADLSVVKEIDIPIPPLPVQRKIAAVLSAYDDLIEVNTRRIRILEQVAQAVYREWFGVVNPESLPVGWEMKTLDYVLSEIESGSRPKGGIDPNQRGVPSIGAENIIGLGKYNYANEKYVSADFYNAMTRGHIKNKDVLIYKDGASIGRKSMFQDGFPHNECCINEHVFILRTNEKCTQNFLYFWLDLPDMTQNIKNLNANAAQPGINQAGVKSLPILLPDEIMLKKLDDFIDPMMGLLFNLAMKNANLQRTRDLLLPRLISGEVGVEGL